MISPHYTAEFERRKLLVSMLHCMNTEQADELTIKPVRREGGYGYNVYTSKNDEILRAAEYSFEQGCELINLICEDAEIDDVRCSGEFDTTRACITRPTDCREIRWDVQLFPELLEDFAGLRMIGRIIDPFENASF